MVISLPLGCRHLSARTRRAATLNHLGLRWLTENDLNWRIFADISLGAASGLWRYVELGRIISRDELPARFYGIGALTDSAASR